MLNFPPNRRWLRFSLRTFLVFVTGISIWASWYLSRARNQKAAAEAVRTYGGWVYYDYEFDDAKPSKRITNESPLPWWLIETFGIDMFHNVVEVNLVYRDDGGKHEELWNTSDEIVPKLEAFPELRRLYLQSTQVTDDLMPHVGRLRNLEEFFVWDAEKLSDQGVEHLGELNCLTSIHITNSRIGDESLRVIGRLPRIERLSLQGNHFSDRGLRYLREMKQLKSLWIGFGHGEITDSGAKHLLSLKSLQELELQHYPISSEMQKRLNELPNFKILFWTPPAWSQIFFRPPWSSGSSRATFLKTDLGKPKPSRNETPRLPPLPFPIYDVDPDYKNGRRVAAEL